MPQPVFRFAPSPNGYLHLGHALSALENLDRARATGGRLLLRIEDIDTARCRPEFEAAIYEDLAWLGLAWEEPVRRQSEHLDDYRRVLDRLTRAGLVYPSFESRGEILRLIAEREAQAPWPRDPDGTPLYPGSAKVLPSDERARRMARDPYALRLDSNAAAAHAGPLVWRETGVRDGVAHGRDARALEARDRLAIVAGDERDVVDRHGCPGRRRRQPDAPCVRGVLRAVGDVDARRTRDVEPVPVELERRPLARRDAEDSAVEVACRVDVVAQQEHVIDRADAHASLAAARSR